MTYGLHFTVREGGLIHETKLPMQELELKMQGGLLWYYTSIHPYACFLRGAKITSNNETTIMTAKDRFSHTSHLTNRTSTLISRCVIIEKSKCRDV